MRVLIVDDDFGALQTARRLLRDEETIVATDTQTALLLADRYRPDVILVDVQLGEENGLEAIEPLLIMSPDSAVLMTSGSDNFKFDASERGAHAWVPKAAWPRLPTILYRVLDLLNGERQERLHR